MGAIALSSTLLYGPMATMPSTRRISGHTAHAASSIAAPQKTSDYNFQDFFEDKDKLRSLKPGANLQSKVEFEGDAVSEGLSYDKRDAPTIGKSGDGGERSGAARKKMGRRSKKADEFGFGDDDNLDGLVALKVKSGGKVGETKTKVGESASSDSGSVMLIDRMAFNNYTPEKPKEERIKIIKKTTFIISIPYIIVLFTRGRIRDWKEKRWVKKGLAIFEEDRRKYLEEKKKNKGQGDDNDGDDDDD